MDLEFETYIRFVLALVFVLALIGLIAWLARRFGLAGRLPVSRGPRRLRIVEVAPIDARRRLVLLGRDGVEHLVLLGANSDLVIESAIAQAGFKALVESQGNDPA
jgi:flagellar protein FliO/FliZ